MAVIGTVQSRFLAPGISGNRRLYTAENIGRALARMKARLADPSGLPITMLSHHAAGDDSKELCARVATVDIDPATSEADLFGYLVDTRAGRDIAAATETDDEGRRVLDAVSIRGWWIGPVYSVEVDGVLCETADDLEIDGVDFTKSPGVAAARLTGATRTTTESDARTPITETVEVTVMTDAAGRPSPLNMPGARRAAADTERQPGEQATTTETAEQARERFDATLAKVREAHVAIGGWQGPVDFDMSAWGISNDDVASAATQLGKAYDAALRVLDPDNDDDLDLPDTTDGETVAALCGACATDLPAGASYCPGCGAAIEDDDSDSDESAPTEKENTVSEKTDKAGGPDGGKTADETTTTADTSATTTETEAATTAVTEDDTTAPGEQAGDGTAPAPTLNAADHDAIATVLAAKLTAAAAPAATTAPTESAPADKPAATEATTAPAAGLTPEQMVAAFKTAAAESSAELMAKVREEIQEKYGSPRRKGLVESAQKGADTTPEKLAAMSPAELTSYAGGIWNNVLALPGEE